MENKDLWTGVAVVLGVVMAVIVALAVFAIMSLIVWGIGNAIIYLFAFSATWTYLQSCITVFALWGIKKILQWICG